MSEYQVIYSEYSVEDLEESVNEAIKAGWRPIGGIAVITRRADLFSYETVYYQAMKKE